MWSIIVGENSSCKQFCRIISGKVKAMHIHLSKHNEATETSETATQLLVRF